MNRSVQYLAAGLLVGAMVMAATPAYAHGSMENPISRVYNCRLENPESPDSNACKAAVQLGGTQPVYDWNEINIPNAAGNHRAIIPNGKLCSAGRDKYKGFDLPRSDWVATNLTSGAQTTLTFYATAPHRGRWDLYVTRNGYNPNQPLNWDTLEATPFFSVNEPPVANNRYTFNVRLPSGKSGRHLIYLIWQRNDSPEAFYSCSDVVFGGGAPSSPLTTSSWAPMVELVASLKGVGTPSYVREPESQSHHH
jgi:predicted carbohydrate-binding protein with CBM5 and CBM33 domain